MQDDLLFIVRLCGVLACLGSLTVLVADIVAWRWSPAKRAHRQDLSALRAPLAGLIADAGMACTEVERYWACVIGAYAMWFCALGAVPIYVLLSPAGVWPAAFVAVFWVGSWHCAVMAHGAMGLCNELARDYDAAPAGGDLKSTLRPLAERAIRYWAPFGIGSQVTLALSSFAFTAVVLGGATRLPTWAAAANVFVLSTTVLLLGPKLLPRAVARWFVPPHIHLPATLPFLLLCTAYAWHPT
jgi:hypothetical protein